MSIAKELPEVDPFFMQECPLCGMNQRMMIRGLYIDKKDGKGSLYPDMGYSFCNCRDIFFTKWQNITSEDGGLNSCYNPLRKIKEIFDQADSGQTILITMRDPYFCNWSRPHEYSGFNPRVNHILWDMDSFASECVKTGFELISADRDMDVDSKTPECYHITLRKP